MRQVVEQIRNSCGFELSMDLAIDPINPGAGLFQICAKVDDVEAARLVMLDVIKNHDATSHAPSESIIYPPTWRCKKYEVRVGIRITQ